ncbi:MAG: DM13 domain-containing protein, partial [Candidatus Saccharibacteria bacterium]
DYLPSATKVTPAITPTDAIAVQGQAITTSPDPKAVTPIILAGGTFKAAPGERIQGTAHIIKIGSHYVVRLEDDFKLGSSPDPIVTLGNDNNADLKINLGDLKGDQGSQNYDVPDSILISNYHQVIIYCRAYHIPLGYADLSPVN